MKDLANRQVATAQNYYGDPIDSDSLLDSFQKFGRDVLPDDPQRPQEVKHRMNGPIMWFIWAAFAAASIRHDELAADWKLLSRAILVGLLADGVFRQRYEVQGFSSNQEVEAILNHVAGLSDAQVQSELLRRYRESGLS